MKARSGAGVGGLAARLLARFQGDALAARATRGTFVSSGAFVVENLLRLISNLVLTRLLFPEDFGLMALVMVVLAGLQMFADLGIGASIVQDSRGDDRDFLDTAWTLQIARGAVLWLATALLAVPAAAFFGEPRLMALLPVAGLSAVLQGFNSTKLNTAGRELRIGRVTGLMLTTQVLGLLATLALAFWLRSVWALVIGGLVAPALLAFLSHVVLPGETNRLRLERDSVRRIFGFGQYIFASTIAGFVLNQGDRLVLGKIASLEVMGFYYLAFALASIPLMLTRRLSNAVLFPAYAAQAGKRDGADGRSRTAARGRALIFSVTLAAALFLGLAGDLIIRILYDPRYETAGPLLVLIALAQVPIILVSNYAVMLLSTGNSRAFAGYTVTVAAVGSAALFAGGWWFGVLGVVVAPGLAALLTYPLIVRLVRPRGGWLPRQDAVFVLVALAGAMLALWINAEVLRDLWNAHGPAAHLGR